MYMNTAKYIPDPESLQRWTSSHFKPSCSKIWNIDINTLEVGRGKSGKSRYEQRGEAIVANQRTAGMGTHCWQGKPKRGSSGSAAARKMSMKSPSWQEVF